MSDPRFARLKSDPRFRKPKKHSAKVVLDKRFSSVLEPSAKPQRTGRVDKYGRALSDTHDSDNLRRFYRLETEEVPNPGPDYARGEVLLESSDEEDETQAQVPESDDEGLVTLGAAKSKPIHVPDDRADGEIDLDEDAFADLDAQAAAYSKAAPEDGQDDSEVVSTRRLAVVNLDWDHVRAVHLFKIFSSVISPSASAKSAPTIRGKVLSVRVYPSQFGKERMEKEEREGPPVDVFKKKPVEENEELDAADLYEIGAEGDYDEDALRQYQLERLRYYYAIVECDTPETAAYLYSELQGTELERSANVFDLSFVPDEMTFDDDPRDESTEVGADYKGIDFVTDALRHSRVKLTWDQDDPERNKITRRTLSRKEMEENDFRAYIASSESESDADEGKPEKSAKREQLRALLLGGGDEVPEGWGSGGRHEGKDDDVDMEVTFMPALSGTKAEGDETTLEAYRRKMKEKRQRRKEELKEKKKPEGNSKSADQDDFFEQSESEGSGGESLTLPSKQKSKKKSQQDEAPVRVESTKDELSLLVGADEPDKGPKHFNMKAVLKAEKKGKKKGKKAKKADDEGENELQEDFTINVKDERFKALHEDYNFAIDPSNPHFKKTKSMAALLEERSKRQQGGREREDEPKQPEASGGQSLQSLVASVKRKSTMAGESMGKRRKV